MFEVGIKFNFLSVIVELRLIKLRNFLIDTHKNAIFKLHLAQEMQSN